MTATMPSAASSIIGREICEGRLVLPMLPGVAAEVIASTVDDQGNAARLALLIQRDQSLASHILRTTNSPAFRGSTPIVSLQQAIARLGMVRIRELAISIAVQGTLFRRGPYSVLASAAWRDSLAAGLWAREVARAARKSVEIGYLCGLLHSIGVPVVLHRLGELEPDLPAAAVAATLDLLAAAAGVQLAEAWALPAPIAATIRHFRDPSAAGIHADLVASANLGAALAWSATDAQPPIEALLTLPATTLLNLYPDDVTALLGQRPSIEAALLALTS